MSLPAQPIEITFTIDMGVPPKLEDKLHDIIKQMPRQYLKAIDKIHLSKLQTYLPKGEVVGYHYSSKRMIHIKATDIQRIIPIGFEGVIYHEVGHSVYYHLVRDDLKTQFEDLVDRFGYPSVYAADWIESPVELYAESFAEMFSYYHAKKFRIDLGIEHSELKVNIDNCEKILPYFEKLLDLDNYIRLNESRLRGGALN